MIFQKKTKEEKKQKKIDRQNRILKNLAIFGFVYGVGGGFND